MVDFSIHLDELIGHAEPQLAWVDPSTSLQEHILNWIQCVRLHPHGFTLIVLCSRRSEGAVTMFTLYRNK